MPGVDLAQLQSYIFNEDEAEKQRQAELKKEGTTYRDGLPYYMKHTDGRVLPIFWLPYNAGTVARDNVGISEREAREAINKARQGKPYNPEHITGAWVYKVPDYWGSHLTGFTGRDIGDVRKGTDQIGARTVNYSVKRGRQAEFEEYTEKYVNWH